MTPSAFYVRHVHVTRLYGIPHSGLAAEDLASGVNVIYGPNGQGKTTFGRAVHGLVWPESVRDQQPQVTGRFEFDGDEWGVTLDGSSERRERAGAPTQDAPNLPGLDERPRYRLSLHDLLQSDGEAFTEIVARNASGGMDIGEAASALGFTAKTPGRGNATREADEARKALRDARGAQASLQAEEAQLDALRDERTAAAQARDRRDALALAAEYAEARAKDDAAQEALDALPAILANVHPTDADDLRALRQKERDASDADAKAEAAFSAATRTLEANAVARADAPAPLTELKGHLATAQKAQTDFDRKADDLSSLASQEENALARFSGTVDTERIAKIDAQAVAALDTFMERVVAQMSREAEAKALSQIRERATEDAPAPEAVAQAEKATGVLREWLRAERVTEVGLPRTLALVGALLCTVLGIALGLLFHPAGYALLVAAAFLAALYLMSAPKPNSRLADIQARYKPLDTKPLAWNDGSVTQRLVQAEAFHARGVAAKEARNYIATVLTTKLDGTDELAAQVEAESREIAQTLGLPPKTRRLNLAYSLRAVQAYQEARALREAAEAEQANARTRRDTTLAEAAALLAPFGLAPPATPEALAGRIEDLTKASGEKDAAERDREAASGEKARAENDREDAARAIAAMFERLGLAPEAEDQAVADAVRDSAGYAETSARAISARTRAEAARQRLTSHPAFESGDDALAAPEAERLQAEASGKAETHQPLTEEITRIQTRVQEAQKGREVEAATARYHGALDALREARDDAADARLGQLFADHAAKASRERQVPAVVRRASEILVGITSGRYTLGFDPATRSFYAADTERDRSFDLDELSSGTRVQMLLSVRVAFVEQQERGARLPLVLDELLANSDEARAAAITQAILALCREGRQVFYLTSQPDEVAKWKRHADETDVECAFIHLGPSTEAPEADALPHVSFAEPPPLPDGHDHASYGAALGVPPWSGHEDTGALHLWYAVEDPAALHALLASGVTRLGAALAAIDAGALVLSAPEAHHLRIYADALRAWREGWREGRGRPVLRETLEACGTSVISDNFIEEVAQYAASLDGDGEALLLGLRNGEVKRFHNAKADALEAYLIEHGYINEASRLDPDAIWDLVVARVGQACASGQTPLAAVRAMLGRVARGPDLSATPTLPMPVDA